MAEHGSAFEGRGWGKSIFLGETELEMLLVLLIGLDTYCKGGFTDALTLNLFELLSEVRLLKDKRGLNF